MPSDWTTSLAVSGQTVGRFGIACAVLSLLPFLPALVSPLPRSPYFPLCIEALVLVTAVVYAGGTKWDRPVRIGAGLGLGMLLLYELYDAAVFTSFRRSGILYEDLQFVENLAYLAFDLQSWRVGGGILLALGTLGGLAWLVPRCLRTVTHTGRYGGCRMVLVIVHLVAWPLVGAVGPALEWGTENLTYQTSNERTRVRTVTTKAAANAQASLRLETMLDSLQTAPVDSTYAAYDTLSLSRRPSVYLFMVESYGSVLTSHPALRAPYRRLMARSDSILAEAGWHMASARSEAPVQGGRSWLAVASLLTGTRVDHQLLFDQFQARPSEAPHLVRFLDRQGYRTVLLQPFTHERPGLPAPNTYDFDTTIYRNDLNYQGPSYGLAHAPDQYSLHFTHDTHLSSTNDPFFLFFETVDSHALWNYGLPPYLEEWRQFNALSTSTSSPPRAVDSLEQSPTPLLPDSITTPVIYDQPIPRRYLRHIAYDLHVLRDYLTEKAPEGSLVILLGDHQPPLLDTTSKTVPMHILSTDSTLVDLARRHGFTDGLLPADDRSRLHMEGLYSLLVRLMTAHDRGGLTADTTDLPPFRPDGISPSLLVQ